MHTGKPGQKRPLGRLRHTWEKTFKMDLQNIGWWYGLIDLAQDRWDRWQDFVNMVMNFQVS